MIAFDIETTTDFKEIRLAGVYDTKHGTFELCETRAELLTCIEAHKGEQWVTWNGAAFDIPLVKELWHIDMNDLKWWDGMIFSRIVNFYRKGGHSLASYGDDTIKKGEVDYDRASLSELAVYLIQDLKLTAKAWKDIAGRARAVGWDTPKLQRLLKVEQEVARSVAEMGLWGIPYDIKTGLRLEHDIAARMERIECAVYPTLPKWDTPKSKLHWPPKQQFKKDGSPSGYLLNYIEKHGATLNTDGTVTTMDLRTIRLPLKEPLNRKSSLTFADQSRVKEYLLSKGWRPSMWNYKTDETGRKVKSSPRLTDARTKEPCPNLEKIGVTWVKDLQEWLTYRSRIKQVESWNREYDEEEKVVHHSANTLGTPTGRFTHRLVVNVPRPGTFLGTSLRELFKAPKGQVIVGWDAQALESVIEAHYCYRHDPEYAEILTSGSSEDGTDIHTRNAELLGITRDMAKTFKYAITYGAGPGKIGQSIGVSRSEAEKLYEEFWHTNEALRTVKTNAQGVWKRLGYIPGLDGRRIECNSEHSVLNYLFQGGGATVMKYAFILAEKYLAPLPCRRILAYHDEEQWLVEKPEYADEAGKRGVQSIEDAASALQLRVPLTGEYKIGTSWADTH